MFLFSACRPMNRLTILCAATAAASLSMAATPDLPSCDVYKLACHYTNSSRPGTYGINRVVIHKTQGATAAAAASWFANCNSGGSAHYTFDKANGYCYQSVLEEDVAWHAGYSSTNNVSIGIEHSGWVANNDTSTACYNESAIETKSAVNYYGVRVSRSYIIAHSEVPGCSNPGGGGVNCHTDPGRYWNWTYYMNQIAATSPTQPVYPRRTTTATGSRWTMTNYNAGSGVAYDFGWGPNGVVPLAGDWNGDGTKTVGWWDDGRWVMTNYNSSGGVAYDFGWGVAGQIPVAGDWDGNGTDTPGTYERKTGTWKLSNHNSGGSIDYQFGWGGATDVPLAGDWNGDGNYTVGLWSGGTWKLINRLSGGGVDIQFGWGVAGQEPVVGDWNNDGIDTPGTYEKSGTGVLWKLSDHNSGGSINYQFGWGNAAGIPMAGDWNNDGVDTVGLAY